MSMKLWYQYPAPLSPFRSVVFQRVIEAIDLVRRPDTEVVVQPARAGAPKTALYAFELVNILTAAEVVAGLRRAESQGFDGAIIGQSLDPGLFAAKELLNIPVAGILESATHFASMWGERIGIVTIPPPAGFAPAKYQAYHRRNIERYGLGGKLAHVDHVNMNLDDLTAKIQAGDHDEIITKFGEAARRCLDHGAEAVIAGDTIISVVIVHERENVVAETGHVVVDLVTSGVKMAESLVDLHRALGIVRSRTGTYAQPGDADLATIDSAFAPGQPAS